MNWYIDVLKKYAVFTGRASRSEYWYFTLFNLVAVFVLAFLDGILGTFIADAGIGILGGIYSLGVLLPSIGVAIRRLHDTNRSGWWLLIGLVPLIGAIVLIVFFVLDSDSAENEYGSPPQ